MRITKSDERLLAWSQLRTDNQDLDLDQALLNINNWWQMLPIDNYYLHWDDINRWPNPWDLVVDGVFCDLAKALGIVYTIHLLERSDVTCIELAETKEGDSLVLVNNGKYILNWAPEELLNTTTLQVQIVRTMDSSAITTKIN